MFVKYDFIEPHRYCPFFFVSWCYSSVSFAMPTSFPLSAFCFPAPLQSKSVLSARICRRFLLEIVQAEVAKDWNWLGKAPNNVRLFRVDSDLISSSLTSLASSHKHASSVFLLCSTNFPPSFSKIERIIHRQASKMLHRLFMTAYCRYHKMTDTGCVRTSFVASVLSSLYPQF